MIKIVDWIRQHQIVAFYAITYTITWGLGFSFDAAMNQDNFLMFPLVVIALCGPALAGISISAFTNTKPKQGSRKAYWIAFFVAWVMSTLVFLANNIFINQAPFSIGMVIIIFVSVVPVAFVISMAYSRNPSVKLYLSSLIHFRVVWKWAIAALLMFPASILLAFQLNNILFDQSISIFPLPATGLTLLGLVVVKFLYQMFFFNATGEEVGWRGFALPRLQAKTSPLISAVVIGLFWAPWHFFLWQAEGRMVLTLSFWITYLIGHILFSILLAWFYNRSKGSILVVGIGHAAVNTATAFIPIQNLNTLNLTWAIIAFLIILIDRMWEKLPSQHLAVYRSGITTA